MVPKLLQKSVRTKKQLGDVVDFIDGDRGKNYPSQGEFSSDGYCLFLSTKNVPDSSFSFREKMFVTEEKDSQLRKGKLQRGDYVLTTRGTVGNFAYYNQKIPFENLRINSGMVILRVKSDDLNRDYLKFYLESGLFKEQVNGRVSGSAQPQLPIRDMLTIGIDLPDIQTQSDIASVLSAYDDLIENNEKRIKALEEMAQLLYTEWFVKFKFPGHEKARMVDSGTEYGMIPEGWEVKKLNDVVHINPITKILKKENVLHIPMEALSNSVSIIDFTKGKRKKGASGAKFQNGDVLFARITPCMQNGKNGFVNFLGSNEVACGSTEFVVMRAKKLTPIFIYFLTRDGDFREAAKLTMVGASGRQRVQSAFFKNYSTLVPDEEVMELFEKSVENNFTKMMYLYRLNVALSKMRDLLIPQLVTGKRILK